MTTEPELLPSLHVTATSREMIAYHREPALEATMFSVFLDNVLITRSRSKTGSAGKAGAHCRRGIESSILIKKSIVSVKDGPHTDLSDHFPCSKPTSLVSPAEAQCHFRKGADNVPLIGR